jgi:hypothetical protein
MLAMDMDSYSLIPPKIKLIYSKFNAYTLVTITIDKIRILKKKRKKKRGLLIMISGASV